MISNRIPKKDVVKFPEIDRAHIYKPRDYLYRSISVKASFFFFFFFPSARYVTSKYVSIARRWRRFKRPSLHDRLPLYERSDIFLSRTYVTRRDASAARRSPSSAWKSHHVDDMCALRSRQSKEVVWKISFRKKEKNKESKGATSIKRD